MDQSNDRCFQRKLGLVVHSEYKQRTYEAKLRYTDVLSVVQIMPDLSLVCPTDMYLYGTNQVHNRHKSSTLTT